MLDLQSAITLLEEGDAREASRLLEEMAEQMPGYPTARVLLARAYERLGEWNLALRAWREVLHMIPNSPVARRGLQRVARKAAVRSSVDDVSPAKPEAPAGGIREAEDADREAAPHGRTSPEGSALAPPDDDTSPEGRATRAGAEGSAPTSSDDRSEVESLVDVETRREVETIGPGESAGVGESADAAEATHSAESADAEEPARDAETAEVEDEDEAETEPRPYRLEETQGDLAEGAAEYGDLDRLIDELQSARIVPRPDLDELPSPDLEDDIEDVVSETLARIYASQGQYEEAAHVYELLAAQQPEKEEEFMSKASEMRSRASDQR